MRVFYSQMSFRYRTFLAPAGANSPTPTGELPRIVSQGSNGTVKKRINTYFSVTSRYPLCRRKTVAKAGGGAVHGADGAFFRGGGGRKSGGTAFFRRAAAHAVGKALWAVCR